MSIETQKPRPKWKSWQYWARLGLFAIFIGFIVIIIGQICESRHAHGVTPTPS